MAQYITTFTGRHFYPLKPDYGDICIEDVAHSLSLLCRANGHYKEFYSVADHCIDCAYEALSRGCGDYMALFCLLHDACEAYISDIPRPVRVDLNGIDEIENNLLTEIYNALAGQLPTPEQCHIIKEIDDCMLYHEFLAKMGEELKFCGAMHSDRTFATRAPSESEREYVMLYNKLKNS
ncbi:MAG: phosphohydrolase [Clostridiales bacterium]|nr:phosphohydrolase [Clostridiales bacterium]